MTKAICIGALVIAVFLAFACAGGVENALAAGGDGWALDEAMRLIPDYNGVMTEHDELAKYRRLASKLEIDAQRWLVGSGLFLEDGRLDWLETFILKRVAKKKHQLWYLTSPRMLDGTGVWDALYAWLWRFGADPVSRLSDDLRELAAKGDSQVPEEAPARFDELVSRSRSDYQLRLGLALIGNFGKPRSDRFEYATPAYNTQLAMLGNLLCSDHSDSMDRAVMAASIVYGSISTCADAKLRAYLPEYARGVVKSLQADEDSRLVAATSSLPALLFLVWRSPSSIYPSYVKKDEVKTDGWYPRLRRKPMTLKQFKWIFMPNNMSDEVIKWFEDHGDGEKKPVDRLSLLTAVHNKVSFADDKKAANWAVRYGGQRFSGSHVGNPEYYWQRWAQGVTVAGDDADRCATEVTIARALGIPALSGRMVIDQGWVQRDFTFVYDVKHDRFFAYGDDVEQRRRNRGVERIQVAIQKIPWDNFRYDWPDMPSVVRLINLDTDEARVLAVGLPAGYLLKGRHPALSMVFEGVLTPQEQTQYNVDKGQ